ncbi:hypothetical protein VM98_37130, partial [Streptomyces rubellomurinus subsp. indigoferus]
MHQPTRHLALAAFVLFSSASGSFGTGGQPHYPAANAILDVLALRRRAEGLPARLLAWALWAERIELSVRLHGVTSASLARNGVGGLDTAEALDLVDRARKIDSPVLVP